MIRSVASLSTWLKSYQVTMSLCQTIPSVGHTCLSVSIYIHPVHNRNFLLDTHINQPWNFTITIKIPNSRLSRHRGITLCSASQNNAAGGYSCGEFARNCLSLPDRQWTEALVLCTEDDGVFLLPAMPQGLSKTRVARSERLAVSERSAAARGSRGSGPGVATSAGRGGVRPRPACHGSQRGRSLTYTRTDRHTATATVSVRCGAVCVRFTLEVLDAESATWGDRNAYGVVLCSDAWAALDNIWMAAGADDTM